MLPGRTSGVRDLKTCKLTVSLLCKEMPGKNCCAVHLGVRSEDAAVEKLLQRVSDGILPDDRREALVQLRDLLTGNPQVRCNPACHTPLLFKTTRGRTWNELVLMPADASCARQRWVACAVQRAAERARGPGDGSRSTGVSCAGSGAWDDQQGQRACLPIPDALPNH